MSIPAQNELQWRQNNSESTNITERSSDSCHQQKLSQNEDAVRYVPPPPTPPKFAHLPMGITRKEVNIIKLTAQFVAVYGMYFRYELDKSVFLKPELKPHFVFLKKSMTDNRHWFYGHLTLGYSKVLLRSQKLKKKGTSTVAATILVDGFFTLVRQVLAKDQEDQQGVEMAMIDFQAFEYFVNMEYNVTPLGSHDIQPDAPAITHDAEPIMFPLLPEGITHKELDIVKLTAQFMAVFGICFEQDLEKSVFMKPELEPLFRFMLSTDSRHDFYSQLALGYTRVLLCIEKLREKGASTETVLEGYFNLLRKVLERENEEGAEMATIDLHVFEYFVEVEYTDWRPRIPGYLSILKNPQLQMQPPLGSPPPPHEEPEPEKQTLDESTFVPEDQFLAQHPGSSTIRVSVPNVNDGQVIEITVQSLSENVASLKEKLANKLELSGKAGVLKDNKSLAHYNVGAGDILTLSL